MSSAVIINLFAVLLEKQTTPYIKVRNTGRKAVKESENMIQSVCFDYEKGFNVYHA